MTGATVTGASGGMAADAGFTLSTNGTGLVLGFSFSGTTIPVGSGVLCYVDASFTGDNGTLWISEATIADALGNSLDVSLGDAYQVGVQETYGCMDPDADNYDPDATVDDGSCEYWGCTDPLADNYDEDANVDDGSCIYPPASYDVYRDGDLLATGVDGPTYVDSGLGANETHCYIVAKVDMGQVIAQSNEACATTDATVSQTVDLDSYRMNMMSLNVFPADTDVSSVFSGIDLLLLKNDDSDYYVPDYDVDQIGSLDDSEGYKLFLNGGGGAANVYNNLFIGGMGLGGSTHINGVDSLGVNRDITVSTTLGGPIVEANFQPYGKLEVILGTGLLFGQARIRLIKDSGTNSWDNIWVSFDTQNSPNYLNTTASTKVTVINPYLSLRYPLMPWFGFDLSLGYNLTLYDPNGWEANGGPLAGKQELGLSRPFFRISLLFGG